MRPSVNHQQGGHMKPAAAAPPRGCPSSASPSRGLADNTEGVMLFGVRLTPDGSMRKSVSMGNLALYHNSSLHGQSSSTPEHSESGGTAADGYVSDGMVQAASSVRERKKGVPWTEDEHKMFLVGLQKLGKGDWRGISRNFVTTRTPTQVASHAQKYFLRQNNLNKRKRRSSLFDIPADYTSTAVPGVDVSQNAMMEFNISSSELGMGSAPFTSNRCETAASNFSAVNITTPFTRPFARPPVNSLPSASARDDAVVGFIYGKLPDNENAQSMLKQGLEMGSQKIASTFSSPFSSMPLPPLPQSSYMERSKLIRPVASLPPSLMRIDEAGEVPSDLRLSIGLPPPPPPPPPSGSPSSSSSSTTSEPNPLALKLEQPSGRHSAFHMGTAAIASNSMGPNGNAISVV